MTSSAHNSTRPRRDAEGQAGMSAMVIATLAINVLRRWWMIVIPAGICLGTVGGAYVYSTFRPSYMAKALVWIAQQDPYLVQPDPSRDQNFVANQLGLIRSSLVLGPAVSDARLADLREITQASDPIASLRARINVARAWGTEHYYVTGVSNNPSSAAKLANAVVESYHSLVGEYRSGQQQSLIDRLEQERLVSEREVAALRDNVRQMTIEQTGRDPFAAVSSLDNMSYYPMGNIHSQLTTMHVEQAVLRAQIASLEEFLRDNPSGVSEEMVDRVLQEDEAVKKQRQAIEQKRMLLHEIKARATDGEASPRYLAVKDEIVRDEVSLSDFQKQIRPKVAESLKLSASKRQREKLAELKQREQDLVIQEAALAGAFEDEVANLKEYSGATLSLELKRAELARADNVMDRIAQRAFMLRTEQRAPQRVEVLELAAVPTQPIEKIPYKKMGMVFCMGLGFPYLLAMLWDLRLRHVMTAEQLQQQTRVPVVGEIATLPLDAGSSRYFGSRRRAGRSVRLFEESVEALRTCLLLTKSLQDAQVLAVVSAATKEGKSTLAAQLAISLARSAKGPTLLVDADMRAPSVHEIFEVPNAKGLVEILGDKATLAESVVTSWDERLHLLPAGRLGGSPHKLVANGNMKNLLDEARKSYRYIVIDTAPVLAAGESLVIAAEADATLVCSRRDVSRQDQVGKAHARLQSAGANVVGSVFSGLPLSYYKYRYGGYYYGEERES